MSKERNKERADVSKFIIWFNDSRVVSWFLTPLWHRFSGTQRLRICEDCIKLTKDNHWSKMNTLTDGKVVSYGHTWLCDVCFYGPRFVYSPDLTTESWLLPKSKIK